jgi:hypothetical protein
MSRLIDDFNVDTPVSGVPGKRFLDWVTRKTLGRGAARRIFWRHQNRAKKYLARFAFGMEHSILIPSASEEIIGSKSMKGL